MVHALILYEQISIKIRDILWLLYFHQIIILLPAVDPAQTRDNIYELSDNYTSSYDKSFFYGNGPTHRIEI